MDESCKNKTCEQCWVEFMATQKFLEHDPHTPDRQLFFIRPPKVILKVLSNDQCYNSPYCIKYRGVSS